MIPGRRLFTSSPSSLTGDPTNEHGPIGIDVRLNDGIEIFRGELCGMLPMVRWIDCHHHHRCWHHGEHCDCPYDHGENGAGGAGAGAGAGAGPCPRAAVDGANLSHHRLCLIFDLVLCI